MKLGYVLQCCHSLELMQYLTHYLSLLCAAVETGYSDDTEPEDTTCIHTVLEVTVLTRRGLIQYTRQGSDHQD